jgi:hypothetical protein
MRHADDNPPIRFMVIARLLRMLTWSRANPVEFGLLAAVIFVVAIRLSGEPWWFSALFGALSGLAAVLFIRPERESPGRQ